MLLHTQSMRDTAVALEAIRVVATMFLAVWTSLYCTWAAAQGVIAITQNCLGMAQIMMYARVGHRGGAIATLAFGHPAACGRDRSNARTRSGDGTSWCSNSWGRRQGPKAVSDLPLPPTPTTPRGKAQVKFFGFIVALGSLNKGFGWLADF